MTTTSAGFRARFESLLGVDQASKPDLYLRMFEASELFSLNYVLELLLASALATFGLVLDSPGVVIGAMLLSPLMGPVLAAGLALAAADLYLGIKSLIAILFGIAVSTAFAAGLVWLLPFQTATREILASTNPTLLDLGVALFSGVAGAVIFSRGANAGGVTVLPGPAIAVSLMPALCTIGFGFGSGVNRSIIGGAGLLFLTNLAAIITSASFVFYLVRMDSPSIRERIRDAVRERASRDWLYAALTRTGLSPLLGHAGSLRWRILMPVAVLAILFVPLRESLLQVRDETRARAAIGESLRLLAPAGTIVTQQIDPKSNPILVRLVVAGIIPPEKVRAAENHILRRTGREVTLEVRRVAGEEELARLRDSLRSPAPPPDPDPPDLAAVRGEWIQRLEKPLKAAWPADSATLDSYELVFKPDGIGVRIGYQAARPFEDATTKVLANVLQSALAVPSLDLVLEHHSPPRRKPAGAR